MKYNCPLTKNCSILANEKNSKSLIKKTPITEPSFRLWFLNETISCMKEISEVYKNDVMSHVIEPR